jgi:carbonic anhydrase
MVDQLLARAAHAPTGLTSSPSLRLAIVTCMDARIDPLAVFGLAPGDAHIIRNAGGRVGPQALRSLALSQRVLGTREVLVAQHTACGLHGFDDEELAATIARETGAPPGWPAGGFDDLEESVCASVRAVRDAPELIHRDRVRGAIIDVLGGGVREVSDRARKKISR